MGSAEREPFLKREAMDLRLPSDHSSTEKRRRLSPLRNHGEYLAQSFCVRQYHCAQLVQAIHYFSHNSPSDVGLPNKGAMSASAHIATARSTTPSIPNVPAVNAATVRLRHLALSDQKCEMATRRTTSTP